MPYSNESLWQRDWPVSDTKTRIGVAKFAPLGHDFPGGVKSGDVAYVLTDLVEHLVHYEALSDGCWGWSYRPNKNNSHVPSRHGAGIAIDFNAPKHPNGVKGTWSRAARAGIAALLRDRYKGCIRAGEFYHSTTDGMHFEINCSPAELAALVRELKGTKAAAKKTATRHLTTSTPVPAWYARGCPIGGRSQEVASALKVLADPRFPQQVTLSDKIAVLFGHVAATYGLPAPGGRSGLTADVARAIADWHR